MRTLLLLLLIGLLPFCSASAQNKSPVRFHYTLNKTAPQSYELLIEVELDPGWHIYSQEPGVKTIGEAAEIKFVRSPLLTFKGTVKESSKLPTGGQAEVRQSSYEDSVYFLQAVELHAPVKTSVKGSIHYQVCNHTQCLPPTTETFNIPIF